MRNQATAVAVATEWTEHLGRAESRKFFQNVGSTQCLSRLAGWPARDHKSRETTGTSRALRLSRRGYTLWQAGSFDDALKAYDQAIDVDKRFAPAYVSRSYVLAEAGYIRADTGKLDSAILGRAIKDCDHAISLDPTLAAPAHAARGYVLALAGCYDDAIAACDRAIELDPMLGEAHANRGLALLLAGRNDEAAKAYRRAYDLDPTSEAAWYTWLGNQLRGDGDPDLAIAAYDKAIALDPNSITALSGRGAAHADLEDFDKAIEDCTRAIRIDRSCAAAYSTRGYSFAHTGHFEDAIADCQRAIRLNPNDAEAYNSLGSALAQTGRLDEAIWNFDEAIKRSPDLVEAYTNRGYALVQADRIDQGLASYDQALEFDPDYPDAIVGRAGTLTELGRIDEALAACGDALRIDPNFAEGYRIYADALAKANRLSEAIAAYERAIELNPNNTDARLGKSFALARMGNIDEAAETVQAVIRRPEIAKNSTRLQNIINNLLIIIQLSAGTKSQLNDIISIMDAAKALKAAALRYGLPKDVAEAIGNLAAQAARENTARATGDARPVQVHDAAEIESGPSIEGSAAETTKPEKRHWKDVARPGEGLVDFIMREFEPELTAGTMSRPALNRYRGLYKAFDNQLRRQPACLPQELRNIPKKPEANDRLVAEGKVTPVEVVRTARRDVKRIATARRRAII